MMAYFCEITLKMVVWPASPSTSATPETARPIPPLSFPPESTQYEDKYKDLYDDPLPLNE